jgi:hypothetical protein
MLANPQLFETGLCRWVTSLYCANLITFDETNVLSEYIEANEPDDRDITNIYYWRVRDIEPRIKWLKKHIKKLK